MEAMKSNFDDVGDFHEKFGLDNVTHHGIGDRDVPPALMRFRIGFLREELEELEEGYEQKNDAKMFDALLDLVYVAMGTAHLRGYPWQDGWNEVQRANMMKVRAAPDGSDSVRGSAWDVVKPPGWVPPNIEEVLRGFTLPTSCSQCGRDLTNNMTTIREVHATSTSRVDFHCPCGAYLGSRAV